MSVSMPMAVTYIIIVIIIIIIIIIMTPPLQKATMRLTRARAAPPPSPAKPLIAAREVTRQQASLLSLSRYFVWAPVRGSARDDYSIDLAPHLHDDAPAAALVFR
jgi:uncharacterized SAM-binding protein YcdF (DUF218 family)